MNRREVCFLLGGSAFGAIAASIFWKHLKPHFNECNYSVLSSVSEAECWPFTHTDSKVPTSIDIITKESDFDDIIKKFLKDVNKVKVIGFDCEWTTTDSTINPIALLQLATSNGCCYLFRLCKLNGSLPKEILEVLKNKSVLKVGVGSLQDGNKLLSDYGISVQGCLDLRALAARYQITEARGLKSLAEELVGIQLNKSFYLRCSDWEIDTLTEKQISYAAYDAFSALCIFAVLLQKTFVLNPPSKEDIDLAAQNMVWTLICGSIQGIVDIPFKERKKLHSPGKKSNNNTQMSTQGIPKNPKLFKSIKPHSTRQQPLYDNCRLQAPDGQLLSTCDRKKALWYMDKNLAELICDDPFTVRLYFEPSGRPDNDRDYYLYEKENKCVVCGATEKFVRKNIVPHEYRKHFALAMKDHTSHDILLLCLPCFQRSNYHDCLFRRKLSEEYQAPHGSVQAIRMFENPDRRGVRSAGRALVKAGSTIPEERRMELERVITEYFEASDISDELIQEASELETRVLNESYVPHGEKVINTIFKAEGAQGLLEFEKRWREHFLTTMKPAHLPMLWSVDHNHEKVRRSIGQMEEEFRRKMKAKTTPAPR